jgi:imidazolonepropionase
MARLLLKNIRQLLNVRPVSVPLYGEELSRLPVAEDAWLLIEDEEIAGFGSMSKLKKELPKLPREQKDCKGRLVMPCWCDSHTHLVFAGSRENEMVDKIRGLDYAAIHAAGGGILSTMREVENTKEDELFRLAWKRLGELAATGTGAVEIKSGYGLTLETELKILRVIKKLKAKSPLAIRSTFLGAHTFPPAWREDHAGYIRELTEEMIPLIAGKKMADYIDVFCEKGFFSPEETEIIIRTGQKHGLKAKLHVNQLHSIGGLETGIKLGAVSMDHLETMTETDIELLRNADWKGFCTLLPTAAFFLRLPYPPARKLIAADAALALATDYNPGSSPSGNMNWVITLACIQMRMLPEEALNAATVNGAYAMGLGGSHGSIAAGKPANLIITQPMSSPAYIPYRLGADLIEHVIIRGEFIR